MTPPWQIALLLFCFMAVLELFARRVTDSIAREAHPFLDQQIQNQQRISYKTASTIRSKGAGSSVAGNYLKPNPDVKTIALRAKRFPSGFRNQMMAFNAFVMWADELGYGQILLQRVGHADTFGTNKLIKHQDLYDVHHWNSYYPTLPRMVTCDPSIHVDFDCERNEWKPGVDLDSDEISPKRLKLLTHELMYSYMHYTRGKGSLMKMGAFPNKIDLLIMQGALRPCPELMELVSRKLQHMGGGEDDNDYMTLHLRIEPDMQRHPVW